MWLQVVLSSLHRPTLKRPPTVVRENVTPDPTTKNTGSRLFPESFLPLFLVRHVVVQHVGAHGLLWDGVDGKYTAEQKMIPPFDVFVY